MIIRKLLWVVGISVSICVAAFAFLVIGSQVHTARTLAGWEEERANRTASLLLFPPAGEDTFSSSTTLGFVPGCVDLVMSTVIAEGPTTVERGEPSTPPDGRAVIDTELVELELQGTFMGGPLSGPVTIRESPTKRSLGQIKQLFPGVDFPAESFFDVFVEVELDLGLFTTTLVSPDPVPMRRIIEELPPLLVDYLPPPDLLVHLYDKETGGYWGCMTHPKHGTIPPVNKTASIPDPISNDLVQFEITILNPHSKYAIPIYLMDQLNLGLRGFFYLQGSPQLLDGPGCVYADYPYDPQFAEHVIWEADCDSENGLQHVELDPRHQAVISFTAQVFGLPGRPIPNIAFVDSPPLDLSGPMTLTQLVPGWQGNLTGAKKEAQPFVRAGDTMTLTIRLPNSGVVGTAALTMTDRIPFGTTYVSGSVTGGATYDAQLNAIVVEDHSVPPASTCTFEYRVLVDPGLVDGEVLSNTAVITDNWGNRFVLNAWTIIAENAVPHKLMFEHEEPFFAGGFPPGETVSWRLRTVDRQGVHIADGSPVGFSNSGGTMYVPGLASEGETGLRRAQDVLTRTTDNGLISGTITSAISQTVVITAETATGLVETLDVQFFQAYRLFLPVVLAN